MDRASKKLNSKRIFKMTTTGIYSLHGNSEFAQTREAALLIPKGPNRTYTISFNNASAD